MKFQDISSIKKYHAHVYFNESTVERAKALCEEAGSKFSAQVGRMHHKPIDPHPCWSFKLARSRFRGNLGRVARQLAFDRSNHTDLLTWLALNRNNLTILIHSLTGNDLLDHTDYASWMGEPQKLNLDIFKVAD